MSVILTNMVKIFPMVNFHFDKQRLAVGTHDGLICIYDVRTSAKWKTLEGHTKNVTCLCFDSKGDYMASYSAVDLTLKLWKIGKSGFIDMIRDGTGSYAKQIKLQRLGPNVPNPHVHVANASSRVEMEKRERRFQESNDISKGAQDDEKNPDGSNLYSANSGGRINRCKVKFLRNDKDVELIREDGNKEIHALIK